MNKDMTREYAIELLVEDLEYKILQESKFVFQCNVCTEKVTVGDNFVWLGSKRKVCINCRDEIIEELSV